VTLSQIQNQISAAISALLQQIQNEVAGGTTSTATS